MHNGLTLEDLSFFDSHSTSTQQTDTKHGQKPLNSTGWTPLSPAGTSASPSNSQLLGLDLHNSTAGLSKQVQTVDEDEFGDFVEFSQATSVSIQALNSRTSSDHPQEPMSSEYRQKRTSSDYRQERAESSSVPIQEQRQELSSQPTIIRLGQTPVATTRGQWDRILSAKPGPSESMRTTPTQPFDSTTTAHDSRDPIVSEKTTQREPIRSSSGKVTTTYNQLDSILVANSTGDSPRISATLDEKLIAPAFKQLELSPKDDPTEQWGFDEDEDDTDSNFQEFASAPAMPPPHQLLFYVHEYVFKVIDHLFEQLVPLSYSMKKRILSRPETKQFFVGFIEAIRVAARIMAGRTRHSLDASQLAYADRESREVVRLWKILSVRLKSLLPSSKDIPDLDERLTFPPIRNPEKPLCQICGLAKNEIVKGQPRPEWSSDGEGHKSCIVWWDNKSAFGIQ
jgi:hypothetical protein